MLLSHAAAVELYRDKYQVRYMGKFMYIAYPSSSPIARLDYHILCMYLQAKKKGSIGLIILSQWYRSLTNTIQDITATQRMTDFEIGW
jgi:hypothetical protein